MFMPQEVASPFTAFDRIESEVPRTEYRVPSTDDLGLRTKGLGLLLVDFHAEATAEKEAFAHYVDGRASLVFGTHTHVPTADAHVLPGGTGYVTDLGMCGAHDSVIGFEKKSSIERCMETSDKPYELLDFGSVELNGIIAVLDSETGKALTLDRIRRIVEI